MQKKCKYMHLQPPPPCENGACDTNLSIDCHNKRKLKARQKYKKVQKNQKMPKKKQNKKAFASPPPRARRQWFCQTQARLPWATTRPQGVWDGLFEGHGRQLMQGRDACAQGSAAASAARSPNPPTPPKAYPTAPQSGAHQEDPGVLGRDWREGTGAVGAVPEQLLSVCRVVKAVGGRLLAVGGAVGASVGAWECGWGKVRAGVCFGGLPPPSSNSLVLGAELGPNPRGSSAAERNAAVRPTASRRRGGGGLAAAAVVPDIRHPEGPAPLHKTTANTLTKNRGDDAPGPLGKGRCLCAMWPLTEPWGLGTLVLTSKQPGSAQQTKHQPQTAKRVLEEGGGGGTV